MVSPEKFLDQNQPDAITFFNLPSSSNLSQSSSQATAPSWMPCQPLPKERQKKRTSEMKNPEKKNLNQHFQNNNQENGEVASVCNF